VTATANASKIVAVEEQTSIAGMVITLHEAGYSTEEIVKELRHKPGLATITKGNVTSIIRKSTGRGADSRMLLAIYEMQVETLGLVRQLVAANEANKTRAKWKAREVERKLNGLPHKQSRTSTPSGN
jgi:hypothetical protein